MMRNRRETMEEWAARLDAQYERLASSPHSVYRAYDEFGVLLYVGCTVNVQSRMSSHRSGSPWGLYMDRYDVEGFANKELARAAELEAIEAAATPFNATQADVNRTQANLNAAKRYLSRLGIFPPQFDIADEDIDTFAETQEWRDHCDEGRAYHDLVDEIRAELKTGDFPYLTPADRLANYLAIRAEHERGAA